MQVPSPRELLDFKGKVVLVTGAGSGIGREIARRFAAAGARVAIHHYRSATGAHGLAAEIEGRGGRAAAFQADLTRRSEVERLLGETVEHFRCPDVLINNAGIYPVTPLLEMKDEDWEDVLDANLKAVHLCTQEVARGMHEQEIRGAVVNIASIEAHNPAPGHSHYGPAKAAVQMYTRSAAAELGPLGVRINTVSPGLIWREGLDEAWPEGVERYRRAVPLGRLGQPEDVADACLFLASPGARWITGAELIVDGGVLTRTVY